MIFEERQGRNVKIPILFRPKQGKTPSYFLPSQDALAHPLTRRVINARKPLVCFHRIHIAAFFKILLLFLSGAEPRASQDLIPFGLARIEYGADWGHGFIVEDHLFTAAHVLSSRASPTKVWLLSQDGSEVDITNSLGRESVIHPKYLNPILPPSVIDKEPERRARILHTARTPFDWAFIKLDKKFPSLFVIDRAISMEQVFDNFDRIGLLGLGRAARMPKAGRFQVIESSIGARAANFNFHSLEQGFQAQSQGNADIWVEPTIPLSFGDSGTPLFVRTASGGLLVMGVTSGQAPGGLDPWRPFFRGQSIHAASVFSGTSTLASWLADQADKKHLFLRREDLRSSDEASFRCSDPL